MKKPDQFEEFWSQNHERFFEEEPRFGHFNRFSNKLNDLHQNKKEEQRFKNRTSTIIAASIAVLALLAIPLFNFDATPSTQNKIDAVDEQLSTSIRESLNNPTMQASFESDEAFQATLDQVNQLEMEYVRLKHQYNSSNHCNNVLNSMKDNLEARLAILDCLNKKEGKPVESPFVHENYLLKHISDCYSEPEFIERPSNGQYTSVRY